MQAIKVKLLLDVIVSSSQAALDLVCDLAAAHVDTIIRKMMRTDYCANRRRKQRWKMAWSTWLVTRGVAFSERVAKADFASLGLNWLVRRVVNRRAWNFCLSAFLS